MRTLYCVPVVKNVCTQDKGVSVSTFLLSLDSRLFLLYAKF